MKHTILVVDDELAIRTSLKDLLEDEGYAVELAKSGEEALTAIQGEGAKGVDAVLLDVWLPQLDGLEVLKTIRETQPVLPVIMLSGHASIDSAVTATKLGAYHFVEKPFSADNLLLTLSHALRETRLEQENVQLKHVAGRNRHEIIGKSPAFLRMLEQIERAAASDAWVLIHGENGTGKESVAHLIHDKSQRRDGPFVEVNCAAIPEELIESELFGHEKGAFTGATAKKIGKFDQANQGILFLDEIADMSLKTQAKILRVLQEQRFERVGGNRTIEVNVRVIAASNRKLEEEIAAGRFREDLYYRLNVLPLDVPPLRERAGDVALLVPHFLDYFARAQGYKPRRIDTKALAVLERYAWPGNVREIRNIVERMMIMTPTEQIGLADIPPAILSAVGRTPALEAAPAPDGAAAAGPPELDLTLAYREAKDAFERIYLQAQLERNDWNISRTAEAIRLERSNLHKKIKSLQIRTERAAGP
ncbi:MAG: sigma-54-dependent Fis family transcriptional regulator [Candidatus Lambdaproteobacteria bacterium]|nr:sigma-54-dependent Fis family transcriptional regulator [Candidatus Lambdaproteobacteria bacterium]